MQDNSTPATPPAAAPAKRVWIPATPEQIEPVLLDMIGSLPKVDYKGPLTMVTMNGHYLDAAKAERIMSPVLQLVHRAHVVMFQESNVDAMRLIARAASYGLNASHRNEREQACGMLFHPRMQFVDKEPIYHDHLLNVPGHPEFKGTARPAIQRRVCDLTSGFSADLINLHAKSNVGESDATRPIRHWQMKALMNHLAEQRQVEYTQLQWDNEMPAILGGDFNAPIENSETTETEPLLNAGFRRVATKDNRWSYQYKGNGGQFDGFFVRGMDGMPLECFIPEFRSNRRDAAFYRDFSDHLPVFMTIQI